MFSNSRDAMNVIIEHYLADGNLSDCYHKKTNLPSGIFFFSSYFLRAIFISMLIRSIQAAMISHNSMWLFCSILCEYHTNSEFIPPSPHTSTTPYLHNLITHTHTHTHTSLPRPQYSRSCHSTCTHRISPPGWL